MFDRTVRHMFGLCAVIHRLYCILCSGTLESVFLALLNPCSHLKQYMYFTLLTKCTILPWLYFYPECIRSTHCSFKVNKKTCKFFLSFTCQEKAHKFFSDTTLFLFFQTVNQSLRTFIPCAEFYKNYRANWTPHVRKYFIP